MTYGDKLRARIKQLEDEIISSTRQRLMRAELGVHQELLIDLLLEQQHQLTRVKCALAFASQTPEDDGEKEVVPFDHSLALLLEA